MAKHRDYSQFRNTLSEKLMDLGNLALAALVFGQFISGTSFSPELFYGGIALMTACYLVSFVVHSH